MGFGSSIVAEECVLNGADIPTTFYCIKYVENSDVAASRLAIGLKFFNANNLEWF